MLAAEYESGEPMPIFANSDIEENKWSAQRYGLDGIFLDHETRQPVETATAIETLVTRLSRTTRRDLSPLLRTLAEPTESVRQLEVWNETGSTIEVAKDLVNRTSAIQHFS